MKILRSGVDGRQWSPTVVNVERTKSRRRRRSLIVIAVLLLVTCFVCSASYTITHRQGSPTATSTRIGEFAPVKHIQIESGWTPVPGNPLISYQILPLPTATRSIK